MAEDDGTAEVFTLTASIVEVRAESIRLLIVDPVSEAEVELMLGAADVAQMMLLMASRLGKTT